MQEAKLIMLYCDESNLDRKGKRLLVWRNSHRCRSPDLLERIRTAAGIASDFTLKFNPCPPGMQHQQFAEVKKAIIETAVAHQCVFLASLTLHDIATTPDDARRNEINRICLHFHYHLGQLRDCGLVLIDQFDDSRINEHLRQKFHTGACPTRLIR